MVTSLEPKVSGTRFLIHGNDSPATRRSGGQATDIDIHAQEIIGLKHKMAEMLASHTSNPVEKVLKDIDRDFFMSAEQAKEYGIVDDIVAPAKKSE